LFASRAPNRPNPIGLTVVKLDRVEGNCLHVSGVDMLDGLPWDNAQALREVRAKLEPQSARMPGEYEDAMKYVMRKIDERLKELEGTG
ncbi:MAG: TrmO family methyltransferase domain-containing protein, partial [Planctomycetota bacterium]